MIDPDQLRPIGIFGKPNGYKGNVVLLDDDICPLEADMFVFVFDNGLPVPWRITYVRPHGADLVVHLRGVDSDTAASAFTGRRAFAHIDDIPEADESDEILYTDLIGYRVFDGENELGVIDDVDDSTDNVLFDILAPDGRHILVPAADDFILELHIDDKKIEMSLPQGLYDLN